jgi:hypothetical protein
MNMKLRAIALIAFLFVLTVAANAQATRADLPAPDNFLGIAMFPLWDGDAPGALGGDALLIEKLLNILLMIVSLLQRKNTSIRRMKELLLGMKEKKRGKDETKHRAEDRRSGADGSSQTDSPKEMASKSTCEGDSSAQGVKSLKRPGHGRKSASEYPGARIVRLNHQEMAPGDPCPESGCEGHLHQLEQPNVKIYLTGQPLISATKYERRVLRCSDCFKRYAADLPEGVKENEKFDETADVAIALYKYSGGMPFYRQARMQESCGVLFRSPSSLNDALRHDVVHVSVVLGNFDTTQLSATGTLLGCATRATWLCKAPGTK